jgi:hypothetical protein
MNWDAIGAIGEVVGAVAVISTLIYLAVQIRQSNRNLAEATSASIIQSFASINSRISSDEQFAELFIRGRDDIDALNPVELERFRAFVQDILNVAVYADGLEASKSDRAAHFDAVNVVGSLYQTHQGFRAVIDSLEAATPRNLVERFRSITPSYSFIERKSDA